MTADAAMAHKVKLIVYPLFTLAAIVVLWEGGIAVFDVPNYILPRLMDIVTALKIGYIDGTLWPHLLYTLKSLVLGYIVGCVIAFSLGALLAESVTFEIFLYPYIVALKSTPKVALAPLIIVWFGFEIESKIVMVALICFFPLFVNTLIGIRQASSDQIDLLRAFSASRMHIFVNVKLPSALGMIFAGLQISVVLGLIGVIVAEFVASRRGLGWVIQSSAHDLELGMMFASIFTLSLIGVVASLVFRYLQSKIVFWEGKQSDSNVVIP